MHTILQNKSKPIKKYDVGELIGTTKKIFPEMQGNYKLLTLPHLAYLFKNFIIKTIGAVSFIDFVQG